MHAHDLERINLNKDPHEYFWTGFTVLYFPFLCSHFGRFYDWLMNDFFVALSRIFRRRFVGRVFLFLNELHLFESE